MGGLWEEVGRLQLDFLVSKGLRPSHLLVDVGCGALRGGVHFVRYLDHGHYFGTVINESLLEAGRIELAKEGLAARNPTLIASDRFELSLFGNRFHYALAQSLFTHLNANQILRCLVRTREVLAPGGSLFASFFEAPAPGFVEPLVHARSGITTELDSDPYHYSTAELRCLAELAGLDVEYVGSWSHPRDIRMMRFHAP